MCFPSIVVHRDFAVEPSQLFVSFSGRKDRIDDPKILRKVSISGQEIGIKWDSSGSEGDYCDDIK